MVNISKLIFAAPIPTTPPNSSLAIAGRTGHLQPMIILVRNIDRAISESEVRQLLETHGKVRTFDLVVDKATGKSKGFGFADMPDLDKAMKAIEALNGFQLGTAKLRVKKAASSSLLGTHEPRPSTLARKNTRKGPPRRPH
jgi:RNA recognition motif-containing protein